MTDYDVTKHITDKATPTVITPELLSQWEAKAKECVNGGFLSRADVMGLLGDLANRPTRKAVYAALYKAANRVHGRIVIEKPVQVVQDAARELLGHEVEIKT